MSPGEFWIVLSALRNFLAHLSLVPGLHSHRCSLSDVLLVVTFLWYSVLVSSLVVIFFPALVLLTFMGPDILFLLRR